MQNISAKKWATNRKNSSLRIHFNNKTIRRGIKLRIRVEKSSKSRDLEKPNLPCAILSPAQDKSIFGR